MDIVRNVGIREPIQHGASKITDTDCNTLAMKMTDTKLLRRSLPNLAMKPLEREAHKSNDKSDGRVAESPTAQQKANADADDEEECAISGRLEIRVIQHSTGEHKSSPNREESEYFDAVGVGGGAGGGDDTKVSRRLASKAYGADRSAPADSNDNGDETAFNSTTTARDDILTSVQKTVHLRRSDSNPASSDAHIRYLSITENVDKSANVMDDNGGPARQLSNASDASATAAKKKGGAAASLARHPPAMGADGAAPQSSATTAINKPTADQPDALPTSPTESQSNSNPNLSPNQANDRKDTNNSISTINNSSHNNSKIPVLNPNARTAKCASWAGNELPLTTNLNELTPGNRT